MEGRAVSCLSSAAVTVFYMIRNLKSVHEESARESGEVSYLQTSLL